MDSTANKARKKLLERDPQTLAAEEIDEFIAAGGDTSRLWTGKGRALQPGESLAVAAKSLDRGDVKPIQRVNVDFHPSMLTAMDEIVSELYISRQAFIKIAVKAALERHFIAKKARLESRETAKKPGRSEQAKRSAVR